MKWWWWLILVAMIAGVLAMAFSDPAQAADNDWGGCTDPKAVNFVGRDFIQDLEGMGFHVVADDSCVYLKCTLAALDVPGVYYCGEGTADDENGWDWINDRLPGMPAYYGKLIDTVGCLDPEADNFMDPQWWPDYNIYNGGCEYGNAQEDNEPLPGQAVLRPN